MIRAAIAIGSNSTRMLAASMDGPALLPLLRLREDTRLFMGLANSGVLSDEVMDRTAEAVLRLKNAALAVGCGAGSIDLYATSATRDAANRDWFARLLKDRTGLTLYVMSGEEEAALAFAAVSDGTDTLAVDIGGGSTEIILGKDKAEGAVSLQAGASRMLRSFPIASRADVPPLVEKLRAMVRGEAGGLLSGPFRRRLVLLGGTGTAAHDMLAVRFPDDPGVTPRRVLDLAEDLADMSVETRRRIPGLPSAKAEHIVHGLCILSAVLLESGAEMAEVSRMTNLDGWMRRLHAGSVKGSS